MERTEASRLGKKAEAPPRRPATNCRRPRLRAARYNRRACEGGRDPEPSPPPSEFLARRHRRSRSPRRFHFVLAGA